ncbi:hypothetical protein BDY19DRAFT_990538 [Irpex rosettiformis]|uniref:Uncharacterized protein n=1 Tax=Irpex rosettiformis TaxID=378272 RepID=A0ACB8UFB8_9APHY|nr:hypothetical protein BDY19DRAFT_990538 [Irpex rosettiformis]
MSSNTVTSLIVIALASLVFVDTSSASSTTCQTVPDFDTLKSKSAADKSLRIGPGGFFADGAADGECYFLSVDQPGFNDTYPNLASTHSDALKSPETSEEKRVVAVSHELEARAKPGCGQVPTDGLYD